MAEWTFLTNHALVLSFLAKHPMITGLEVSREVGITERAVRKIIADLEKGESLIFAADSGQYDPNAVQVVDDGVETKLRFSEDNTIRSTATTVTVTLENVSSGTAGGWDSVAEIQAAGYTIQFM